jgi:hypothetical protein
MSLFGHNPGAVGGRESIGSTDANKPWNRDTKVLAPEPSRSSTSSAARNSGSGALRSSPRESPPARNDRRGGYEKDARRIRNEDPIYGRR